MSTEHTFEDDNAETRIPPPVVDVTDKPKGKKKPKDARDDDAVVERRAGDQVDDETTEPEAKESGPKLSGVAKEIKKDEEVAIKDILDQLGPDGAFKIVISRSEPTEVRDATGKIVNCKGFLETVTRRIEPEEYIQRKHGGGLFHIKFLKRDDKNRMNIFAHRMLSIGGEPIIENLPRNPGTIPAGQSGGGGGNGESEGMAKAAFTVLADELKAARSAPQHKTNDDLMLVVEMLKSDRDAARAEMADLRRELADTRNKPPADDSFKETMIKTFVADDGHRTQAVRLSYEAEIRALKEGFEQERARLADRAERDRKEIADRAERDMQRILDSKNAEIASLKSSQEVSLNANKIAQETQITVYKSEINKLERDNKDLRDDVRELRAKKEKSLVEQAKEIQTVKEALGLDDDEDEKDTVTRVLEAIPAIPGAFQAAKGMFGGQGQAQPQPPRPGVPVANPSQRQVYKDPDTGKAFTMVNGKLVPLKKKQAPPVQGAPGEPPLPQVDPAQVAMVIGYLEKAYANTTDPAVVAQSGRTYMTEPLLVAIRELGVEQFLLKVGKVPMSSPLVGSLKGKNWARAVGKALVGEE
jgi:hypothetical protein